MKRAFSLGVLAVSLLLSAAVDAADPAMLKSSVVVSGEKVTLGDLFDAQAFESQAEAAQVPVLSSPKPGETLSLDAIALRRFAAAHGIDWPNTQQLTAVKIERSGTAIATDLIDKAVLGALEARGLEGKRGLRYSSAVPTLYVGASTAQSVSIEKISADLTTGQFSAVLRAPAGDPSGTTATVTGRAYAMSEVPVLTRDIKPGEPIAARDVTILEMPTDKLGQNLLTATSDLVGMAPRRMIRAGQPVRLGDVEPPLLVKKDSLVTMTMRAPGMTLTAEGKALQDGAAGEAIRVMNTNSKRVVVATVRDEGQVDVTAGSAARTIAANATPIAR